MSDASDEQELIESMKDATDEHMLLTLLIAATDVVRLLRPKRQQLTPEARNALAILSLIAKTISGERIRRIDPAMLEQLQRIGAGRLDLN